MPHVSRFTFHASSLPPLQAGRFWFHRPMSKASLAAIVRYCDQLLRTAEVQDYERAANGLQVENRRHGHADRSGGGREPGDRPVGGGGQSGLAAGASRAFLGTRPPVDGQTLRADPLPARAQPRGLQLASAAGCPPPPGQQRPALRRARTEEAAPVLLRPRPVPRLSGHGRTSHVPDLAGRLQRATGAKPR